MKPMVNLDQKTRLNLLTDLYNEQLDQLVRSEVDLELFEYLKIAEPSTDYSEKHKATELNVKRKQKIIEIVLKKIHQEMDPEMKTGSTL